MEVTLRNQRLSTSENPAVLGGKLLQATLALTGEAEELEVAAKKYMAQKRVLMFSFLQREPWWFVECAMQTCRKHRSYFSINSQRRTDTPPLYYNSLYLKA